jgi:glutathione S-transferase
MRLYYGPATAAMAPHAALAEAGADYELVLVERKPDGMSPPDYLEVNPWGRVPALDDDGLVLTEAAAIALHIADRFPDAGLIPALGTPERSQVYRYLMYLTNTVQAEFMHFFYPERYTVDPASAPGMAARESDLLEEHFDWLNLELDGRTWLAGDRRSVADLYLFMLTRWGRRLDQPAWDSPNLRRHFLATAELPGVRRMLDEQGIDLPVLG